ncbi:MAG: hypothetical protein ACE5KK_04735 [Candidatus Brocadiales bacterium]
MKPIILAFLALLLGGTAYFNAWIKLCLLFMAVFFSLNVWICHGLLVPGHSVMFWTMVCIFVLWPTFLLILFDLDMRYGWFCFDMSYSWVFVWALGLIFFGINLVGSVLRLFLAGT